MAAFKVCLLCSLLWIVAAEERKEVTITCRPSEECVLPCQFESDGKGARIMWYRKKAVVSCTRYGNTSFAIDHKSPADKYKGRTGLFADQVLEGNATLLLRNVTPYDQGKYYCITMTAPRIDKSSIISLVVEAPVREVDIWFSGDSVICAAEGIYPAPTVAWSSDPPTDAKLNKTEIQENKLGFYDIQSDLRLKGNLTSDLTYICCVTCGTNRKTAFLKHEASVAAPVGGVVQISCSLPRSIQQSFNLTWRFRLSGPVASISVVGQKLQVKVWDPWKSHVLSNFSASNGLHLHNLKSEHQGNYTCEIRTPEETHVTWTDVTVTEESYHYFYISIIAGLLYFLFLSYVASAILAYIIIKLKRARNRPDDRDEASESLNGQ